MSKNDSKVAVKSKRIRKKTTNKPRGKPFGSGSGEERDPRIKYPPIPRPKSDQTYKAIAEEIRDMTPTELIQYVGAESELGIRLGSFPPEMQLKYLTMLTAQIQVAEDPAKNVSLLKEIWDRSEGTVKQNVDLTSNGQSVVLSDAERLAAIATIFDAARARSVGQTPNDGQDNVPASTT